MERSFIRSASAAATYGIGSIFNGVGTFGHELLRAGAHGLSSGVFNALNGDNFWKGLISGAASSGIGSLCTKHKLKLWTYGSFHYGNGWNRCMSYRR